MVVLFCLPCVDPRRYGVVEFDKNLKAVSIEGKASGSKIKLAVPGLYFTTTRSLQLQKYQTRGWGI
jgi:glucose-1-phosphate thymidylyltransferase